MKRRSFLQLLALSVSTTLKDPFARAQASLFTSPRTTNRLRPPGAVDEEFFVGKCIRCGRCVESCPYHAIFMLDIRHGVHAGTPLLAVDAIPCYLCMRCVTVCPTGSLQPVAQKETRMGMAIINTFICAAWSGVALCRTCYDVCPFKGQALDLNELKPLVNREYCTGCGLCTHACPITGQHGLKAINIEPLSREVGG
nr:4Fe-4S dicluster domain-containing protein [uncultured Desulfobulbus sp.]